MRVRFAKPCRNNGSYQVRNGKQIKTVTVKSVIRNCMRDGDFYLKRNVLFAIGIDRFPVLPRIAMIYDRNYSLGEKNFQRPFFNSDTLINGVGEIDGVRTATNNANAQVITVEWQLKRNKKIRFKNMYCS